MVQNTQRQSGKLGSCSNRAIEGWQGDSERQSAHRQGPTSPLDEQELNYAWCGPGWTGPTSTSSRRRRLRETENSGPEVDLSVTDAD